MALEKFEQNTFAIKKAVDELDKINYDSVAAKLPQMLAEGRLILDASAYKPLDPSKQFGVGRYLVYEHKEAGNQFSIWAFAFAPRQKTSIHDHKYRGTVTVLEGTLSEKFYTPEENKKATLDTRFDRHRFHSNQDDNKDVLQKAHQLKYRKGKAQPHTVADSEEHNRNLLSIFSKKPQHDVKSDYVELGFKPQF